jgi:hypothetical protein
MSNNRIRTMVMSMSKEEEIVLFTTSYKGTVIKIRNFPADFLQKIFKVTEDTMTKCLREDWTLREIKDAALDRLDHHLSNGIEDHKVWMVQVLTATKTNIIPYDDDNGITMAYRHNNGAVVLYM